MLWVSFSYTQFREAKQGLLTVTQREGFSCKLDEIKLVFQELKLPVHVTLSDKHINI